MQRSWIGAGLLAALLIGSLLADWGINRCHTPVSRDLSQASHSVLNDDWPAALQLSQQAMDHWQRCQPFRDAMGNQSAMEKLDSLFARLKVYLRTRDPQTAALCAEIAQRVSDLHPQGIWWELL